MNSTSHLLRPVDLEIVNQDWNKVIEFYYKACAMRDAGKFTGNYIEEILSTEYSFKEFGSITTQFDENDEWYWDTISGKIFDSFFPWLPEAKKTFKNLNLANISLSLTPGDIKLHIDAKKTSEKSSNQCKINYVVSTEDPNAVTTVYDINDKNIFASYPSIPQKFWLLNTDHPHEVKSNGFRIMFYFKFYNSFEEVADRLAQLEPIRFIYDLNNLAQKAT